MEELLAGIDRQYTQGFAGNENDNAGENNHVEEPCQRVTSTRPSR